MNDVDVGLAREGFHRIGRIDAVGRRSLWLREEADALELRAGREGQDVRVRITEDNPLYHVLRDALGCARFAAEWEHPRGRGLDDSYAFDVCPVSIYRREEK